MNSNAFGKLSWGFFFIMLDFRIQGIDIFPDIIGYILFASGLGILVSSSENFKKAGNLNIVMIVLSILDIYQRPVNATGFHMGSLGPFGLVIGLVSLIVGLILIYNMFMGISQMAREKGRINLSDEAEKRWTQYLILQIASLAAFILIFIPVLSLIYVAGILIAYIFMTFIIMGFMKRCGEGL